MTARIVILATAIVVLAPPTASAVTPAAAGKRQQVPVEAVMTLHRLPGNDWQLDVENSTPLAVTISQITWSPPAGMKVGRIVSTSGGRCTRWRGGFRCRTQLVGPSCLSCQGADLTVRFDGTGPRRRWVRTTGSGGFWEQQPLENGRAVLTASQAAMHRRAR